MIPTYDTKVSFEASTRAQGKSEVATAYVRMCDTIERSKYRLSRRLSERQGLHDGKEKRERWFDERMRGGHCKWVGVLYTTSPLILSCILTLLYHY